MNSDRWLVALEFINVVIGILNLLVIALLPWIVSAVRKNLRSGLAENRKVEALDLRMTRAENRIALVEKDVEYQPSQDDIDALRTAISSLSSEVHAHTKQLETVEGSLRRIEDYLLSQSRT